MMHQMVVKIEVYDVMKRKKTRENDNLIQLPFDESPPTDGKVFDPFPSQRKN